MYSKRFKQAAAAAAEDSEDSEVDSSSLMRPSKTAAAAASAVSSPEENTQETTKYTEEDGEDEDDEDILGKSFSSILAETATKAKSSAPAAKEKPTTPVTPTNASSKAVVRRERPMSEMEQEIRTRIEFQPSDFIINGAPGKNSGPMVRVIRESMLPEHTLQFLHDDEEKYFPSGNLADNLYLAITQPGVNMGLPILVRKEHRLDFINQRPASLMAKMASAKHTIIKERMQEADKMYALAMKRENERLREERELAELKPTIILQEEVAAPTRERTEVQQREIAPLHFTAGMQLDVKRYLGEWEKRRVKEVKRDEHDETKTLVLLDNAWWLGAQDYVKRVEDPFAFTFEELVQAGSTFELGQCDEVEGTVERQMRVREEAMDVFHERTEQEFPEFAHMLKPKQTRF